MALNQCSVLCLCTIVTYVIGQGASMIEEEKQPTTLSAAVGDHVVFNCRLDFPQGFEIPYTLRWNKEKKEIFLLYDGVTSVAEAYEGRIALLQSGINGLGRASINLTNIRETDHGWYECKVLFPNRTPVSRNNGTWFYLTVDGGNLIAIPPMNQTVLEGNAAEFPCVTKVPDNTKVRWLKDGKPISDLEDLRNRALMSADGSLSINPTNMGDLGEYTCETANSEGELQSAKAFLDVQYPAKVVYAPKDIFLAYGRPAILDCHYYANPPLTNLRWTKDGYLFDPYNVQGVFYRKNGSLFMSKADDSHTGRYACTPYNDLGTAGPSPPMDVIVRKPPILTVRPHNLYLKKLGDTVDMHCDASDSDEDLDRKPIIEWKRKDGLPLPKNRYTQQGGNISIEYIEENDRGLYTCTATNEAASVSVDTELVVENIAPRAPYNLTAETSRTSVTLHWIPGHNRPHLEYNIWYRSIDTPEWRTMRVLSSKASSTTVPNLTPGREYEFIVLCQDSFGDGMFSRPIRAFTKGERIPSVYDAPLEMHTNPDINMFQQIGPPANISIRFISDGYLLTWDPPQLGREVVFFYEVVWTREPSGIVLGRIQTRDNYFLIGDLAEDETYNFQITGKSVDEQYGPVGRVTLAVPAYRRIGAVAIAIATSVLLLSLTLVLIIYARRKWCSSQSSEDNESNVQVKAPSG